VTVSNQPHNHGFATTGEEIRTTTVEVHRAGHYEIVSGFKDLKLCKTTQSGYEGFLHDRYTLLPDTRERLLASSITASWR
jgi:urate oxidase